jgi:hypothetical protein
VSGGYNGDKNSIYDPAFLGIGSFSLVAVAGCKRINDRVDRSLPENRPVQAPDSHRNRYYLKYGLKTINIFVKMGMKGGRNTCDWSLGNV